MDASKQPIGTRLNALRDKLVNPDFLAGKGLSGEVNSWLFCYDPADEMAVREFTDKIARRPLQGCNVIQHDLYRVFLDICRDRNLLDDFTDYEQEEGKDEVLTEIHNNINQHDFVKAMDYEPKRPGDVVLLTGVGEVFPFMRVHVLLNTMQDVFEKVPIVVMYPGSYDGLGTSLFDKLPVNRFYRAYNVI